MPTTISFQAFGRRCDDFFVLGSTSKFVKTEWLMHHSVLFWWKLLETVWQALETCKCCRNPGSQNGWLADIVSRNWDKQLWYMETVLITLIEIGDVPLSTCLTGCIIHQTLPVDFSLNWSWKLESSTLRSWDMKKSKSSTSNIPLVFQSFGCVVTLNVKNHPPINWCNSCTNKDQ